MHSMPSIVEIIVRSIKTAQEHLHDCQKRCFSLLGYDILLDQECQPWLLQVNMSPACEERTAWLKEYLTAMGQGMLKIVLPEEFMEQRGEPNEGQRTMMQPMASESLQRINTDVSQDLQVYPTTVLEPSSAIPLSMPRRQSSMTSQLNNWAAGSESD